MPSAFIIQTLLNTLHCRFHCSFCRTGEEGNCVKCSVVVPGGSCCSCCWERFSPEAEVLSSVPAVPCMAGQPGTVLERLPESPPCKLLCWAAAHTMCWETDSGLCFLELLFKCFEQHCSRWGFLQQGNSSRRWLFPQSAPKHCPAAAGHRENRFVLPPPKVEQTPWFFLFFSPLCREQWFAVMCISQKRIRSWDY